MWEVHQGGCVDDPLVSLALSISFHTKLDQAKIHLGNMLWKSLIIAVFYELIIILIHNMIYYVERM